MTFRSINGAKKSRKVLTNRGATKAVYLASLGGWGALSRFSALDVEVRDDGPPELDGDGKPILSGYGIDRDEW